MQHHFVNGRTPEEHYAILDDLLTNVLVAAGATATDQLMDQLVVYERCLRVALGMRVEVNG